ncbi:uncharacterized protein LOC117118679 [Anneissia japonica]|uniref:uncharacterized protein LOC117118679 n=1 Tax=Anneissia japonica TaxID=1529436 RepID=UPI00142558F0|nr:uncharacterized protein LOC117118679 [Anneissia japonica]
MRPEAMDIVKLIIYGDDVRIKIRCRIVKTTVAVILNDKRQEEIVFEVDEINKRTMARLIIWLCGNEGSSHTKEQATLRRLIQACISLLEKQNNRCWKDTKVSLYGQDATSFHVLAGKSLDPIHIVGFVKSTGEFQIVERHNSFCIIL